MGRCWPYNGTIKADSVFLLGHHLLIVMIFTVDLSVMSLTCLIVPWISEGLELLLLPLEPKLE